MKTVTLVPVHVLDVTEYEGGWGGRPDGYLVALNLEALANKRDDILKHNSPSYGSIIHGVMSAQQMFMTEEGAKAIGLGDDVKAVWVDKPQFFKG